MAILKRWQKILFYDFFLLQRKNSATMMLIDVSPTYVMQCCLFVCPVLCKLNLQTSYHTRVSLHCWNLYISAVITWNGMRICLAQQVHYCTLFLELNGEIA